MPGNDHVIKPQNQTCDSGSWEATGTIVPVFGEPQPGIEPTTYHETTERPPALHCVLIHTELQSAGAPSQLKYIVSAESL